MAAATHTRSIPRQASIRTLDDPSKEPVHVEVRPVGRCYLVVGITEACPAVASQSPGLGGEIDSSCQRPRHADQAASVDLHPGPLRRGSKAVG